MKKICTLFALFCALFFFAACKGGKEEGIYLGIIGFNDAQYIKNIDFLDDSSKSDFTSFIYDLTYSDGTSLYFADYTALKKMRDHSRPPKLKKVALVTFTDGLDNMSLAKNESNPEDYSSQSAYRDAIHNMIANEKIHGHKVDAYTIGLKGKDVEDDAQFEETLKKLASNESNVFPVSNMEEAMEHFDEIAKGIYSVSTTVNLDVKLPGGYDDGQLLRFTFDSPLSAQDSNLYLEATYNRSKDTRTLEKITAKGLTGVGEISSNSEEGGFFHFVFKDLKYSGSESSMSESDISNIELWKQTSTGGWDRESEFNPESSSTVTEDKNSALIMLVLDCTTSLGSDFAKMKQNANDFVTTLVYGSSNSNGSSNDPISTPSSSTCRTIEGNMWSSLSSNEMFWEDAVDYCENLNECGHTDWRLPSISELRTLIQNCLKTQTGGACQATDNCLSYSHCYDNDCSGCDYDPSGKYSKLGDDTWLWSSSLQSDYSNYAWHVYFSHGGVDNVNTDRYTSVRCVR